MVSYYFRRAHVCCYLKIHRWLICALLCSFLNKDSSKLVKYEACISKPSKKTGFVFCKSTCLKENNTTKNTPDVLVQSAPTCAVHSFRLMFLSSKG